MPKRMTAEEQARMYLRVIAREHLYVKALEATTKEVKADRKATLEAAAERVCLACDPRYKKMECANKGKCVTRLAILRDEED